MARGWTADWLNAWFAAIGTTVLVDGLRLSWRDGPRPAALLHDDEAELVDQLYASLPSPDDLDRCAIARSLDGAPDLPRNFGASVFRRRGEYARTVGDWSLGVCATDLVLPRKAGGDLDHAPFDVPMPRGITLWERVVSCREAITEPGQVAASLRGTPALVRTNGLGFDPRRLEQATTSKPAILVDPVVELCAWAALIMFPATEHRGRVRARGWLGAPSRPGAFTWGAWDEPLDRWGIDARLDRSWPSDRSWSTVPYRPSGSADVTRAYASRRAADA